MDHSTRTDRTQSIIRSFTAAALVAAVGLTSVLPGAALAQRVVAGGDGDDNGQRDENFAGDDGLQTTDFGRNDRGFDMVVQNDNRILVVGDSRGNNVGDVAVVRYTPDGNLDNTCSGDGMATFDFGGREDGRGIAIQGGQAVIVGTRGTQNGKLRDVLIFRINLGDCSLDGGFNGGTGRQIIDLGKKDDQAEDVAIYPDGRIAVVGKSGKDSAVIRLLAGGGRDNSFDGDGVRLVDLGKTDSLNGVAIQTINGVSKIVAAGTARKDFVVARFLDGGALDTTFDADGKQGVGFGADDVATAIAIQPTDNKIVAVGYSGDEDGGDFAVLRLEPDGGRDGSFGNDNNDEGEVETDFDGLDRAFDVAFNTVDGELRIVVAGFTAEDDNEDANFAIARYRSNGQRDGNFGNEGRVRTNFGNDDQARAVGIQVFGADPAVNRIVVAGYTDDSGDDEVDFAVARFFVTRP